MATRKTEKDKKIEALEAANDALRRKNRYEDWLAGLTLGRRILYAALLTVLVLSLVFYFTFMALEAAKPIEMTKSRYILFLSETDQRRWKVSKGTWEAFCRHIHGAPTGFVHSYRAGDTLCLEIDGEMTSRFQFSFHDGRILGMVSSYPSVLTYSESALKSGRALTLLVGNDKLVFYEE